ncbi:MAG TPA: hypothetical protein VI504_01475 [Candidatus Eisenbacteria bacterium]|jgi:hypothetical protein
MTAREKPRPAPAVSRRQFVTLVAAGSAALLAPPVVAASASRKPTAPHRKPPIAAAEKPQPPAPTPAQKEFDRQRAGTLTTLKTLREFPLPPGGDLPVVFRPQRTGKRER